MDQTMPQPDPAASQPAPDQPDAPDASADGYEICIKVQADGTFAVTKEPLDEAAEPSTPGQAPEATADDAGHTVNSFEDALKAALRLFKTNPVQVTEETQFQSGHREIAPSTDQGMSA